MEAHTPISIDRQASDDTAEQNNTEDHIVDEDDAKEYDWDELSMMIGYAVLAATIADCGPLVEYTGAKSDIEYDEPIRASGPNNQSTYMRASTSFRGDMIGGSSRGGFNSTDYSQSASIDTSVKGGKALQPHPPISKSGSSLYASGPGNPLPVIHSREPSRESLAEDIQLSNAAANELNREAKKSGGGSIAKRAAALEGLGVRKDSNISTSSTINSQQPSYDTADIERSNNLVRNETASASYDAIYSEKHRVDGAIHELTHRQDEDFSAKAPTPAVMPPGPPLPTNGSVTTTIHGKQKQSNIKDRAAALNLPGPPK